MLGNPITILALSAIFGFAVKMADLLDEHGLKWFKGSAILFGIVWGSVGALLILSNNMFAAFFIAILLQWILRYRIDYLNHGIAASIMLVTFFYNLPNFIMDWTLFLTIFISYSLFGLLNDAADRGEISGKLGGFLKLNAHLIIFPLILLLFNTDYWIVLASSILQIVFYEFTARMGAKVAVWQETNKT